MSGIDEQLCDIGTCTKCGNDILTWPFGTAEESYTKGHFNIPKNDGNRLSNTVYLFNGLELSDIERIRCYGCNHVFDKGSAMFKSVMIKARDAEISME